MRLRRFALILTAALLVEAVSVASFALIVEGGSLNREARLAALGMWNMVGGSTAILAVAARWLRVI